MGILRNSAAAIVCASVISGCVLPETVAPTPLQIQSFQTKEFETSKAAAFGSVLSVFQDLGYIVASADKDTGFITAASPSGDKSSIFDVLAEVSISGQTKATAVVEEIRPGFTSIRLNFVNTKRRSTSTGQVSDDDKAILDPQVYQSAFAKIEDAIFVRSSMR